MNNIPYIETVEDRKIFCVYCFVDKRSEIHSNEKKYRIINPLNNYFLFDDRWNLEEEIRLLDSLGNYGFDNWESVSKNVESKSTEECRDHYMAVCVCLMDSTGTGSGTQ